MLIVMMIFLITYVVPQFAKLYQNLGAHCRQTTVIMLSIGRNASNIVYVAGRAGRLRCFFSGAGRRASAARH